MTIKEFAYSAQQHLRSITGCLFKRAHIYELLASSFGFKSYAALCVDHVFTQRVKNKAISVQHQTMLQQRVAELGYESAIVDAATTAFISFLSEQRLDVLGLTDVVAELNAGHGFSEGLWFSSETDEYSPILLGSLEANASKGDHRAHYALALMHEIDDDEYKNGMSGEHWYSQGQQGRVLTGVEKEWADAYARQLNKDEKYKFHLREAGKLGNASALVELAGLFDDPSYLDAARSCGIPDDPIKAADIAESLGQDDGVRYWMTIAAETGNTYAMRRLIEEYDHENLHRCWTWIYLAQLVGTDLTKDAYYAVNEDGSPYDDDVGGAAFVDGQDGLRLSSLDTEDDAIARQAADELFNRIQKSGQAYTL